MKLFLYLSVLSIIFLCCKNDLEKAKITPIEISFDEDSFLDSSRIEIHDIIQLENIDSAIFRRVARMEFFDDKIFILDKEASGSLFLFEKDGHFLRRTKKGRGPGENQAPTDFFIDVDLKQIQIFDVASISLKIYDLDLNYSSEIKIGESVFFRDFKRLGDSWLVHSQNKLKNEESLYSFRYYSKDFSDLKQKILPEEDLEFRKIGVTNPISREDDETLICRPFDQYLYSIDIKKGAEKKYFLDFGDKNLKRQDIDLGIPHVYNKMREGSLVTIHGNPIHTENYVACSFLYKQTPEFFIYSKIDANTFVSVNSTIIPKGELKCLSEDGKFVLLCSPRDFLQYIQDNKLEMPFNIDPNGNNLLVAFSY